MEQSFWNVHSTSSSVPSYPNVQSQYPQNRQPNYQIREPYLTSLQNQQYQNAYPSYYPNQTRDPYSNTGYHQSSQLTNYPSSTSSPFGNPAQSQLMNYSPQYSPSTNTGYQSSASPKPSIVGTYRNNVNAMPSLLLLF